MLPKIMRIGSIMICLLIVALVLSNLAVSKQVGCPSGKMDCDGQCINVKNDENNCGYCRNSCDPSESCKNGECVSSSCGKNCDDVNPCTNDFCIRGKCVNVVPDGMVCCEGQAVLPEQCCNGTFVPEGLACCNGEAVPPEQCCGGEVIPNPECCACEGDYITCWCVPDP